MEYAVRHPRIGDSAIAFEERATIVGLSDEVATIDGDDDLRVTVSVDRLRWVGDRSVWVIIPPDFPEPAWLHEDTSAGAA